MHSIIENHNKTFEDILEFSKKELATLRTGRANSIMVENIVVESYGAKMPIKQMAAISVPDARTLVIQPWDQNVIKEIEKAIVEADIGIRPVNEGKILRLVIPELTSESRQELVKNLHKRMEQGKIKLRNLRDKIREEIMNAEKDKQITEDDKFAALKDLDETTREYVEKIKTLADTKEKEIMTI